jgi:hypothetical protein
MDQNFKRPRVICQSLGPVSADTQNPQHIHLPLCALVGRQIPAVSPAGWAGTPVGYAAANPTGGDRLVRMHFIMYLGKFPRGPRREEARRLMDMFERPRFNSSNCYAISHHCGLPRCLRPECVCLQLAHPHPTICAAPFVLVQYIACAIIARGECCLHVACIQMDIRILGHYNNSPQLDPEEHHQAFTAGPAGKKRARHHLGQIGVRWDAGNHATSTTAVARASAGAAAVAGAAIAARAPQGSHPPGGERPARRRRSTHISTAPVNAPGQQLNSSHHCVLHTAT